MTIMTIELLRKISLRLTPQAWCEAFDGLPVDGRLLDRMLHHDAWHLDLLGRFARVRDLPSPVSLPPIDTRDGRMLLATDIERAAAHEKAGLACWSAALAREVEGRRLRVLHANFDRDALLYARRWQAVARSIHLPAELDHLPDVIRRAGQACALAWRATLPQAWQAWIGAVSPASAAAHDVPEAVATHGAAIWRDAAQETEHAS